MTPSATMPTRHSAAGAFALIPLPYQVPIFSGPDPLIPNLPESDVCPISSPAIGVDVIITRFNAVRLLFDPRGRVNRDCHIDGNANESCRASTLAFP
jgi:hypothetical protein